MKKITNYNVQSTKNERVCNSQFVIKNLSEGQILIEAIIAMGILTVAVFAIFSLLSRSISLNRVVSNEYVATYLAAEGLEVVKNIIDTNIINCDNWNEMTALGKSDGTYEVEFDDTKLSSGITGAKLKIDSFGRYRYSSEGKESPFKRTIELQTVQYDDGSDPANPTGHAIEMRAVSKVEWEGRGNAAFDVELEDHFFPWLRSQCGALTP